MTKYYIIFISCFIINLNQNLQAQFNIEWQKSLGGNAIDLLLSSAPTADGGSILAGYSNSNDGDVSLHYGTIATSDYWIVKLNVDGEIVWQKTYGGTKNDAAYAVQPTSDGGYIVAGESYSNDMDVSNHIGLSDFPDYWIIKLDGNGDLEWEKSYGGTNIDAARSIMETDDDGFIVAGYSWSNDENVSGNHGFSDYWVIKISSVGTLVWQKSFGGSSFDAANSIIQSEDGEYIVAGNTYSNDGDVTFHSGTTAFSDCWIIKLYSDGTINWQRSFGGTDKDEARAIKQTSDDGFIITGNTSSSNGDVTVQHGDGDYWVFKIGLIGNLMWEKSLGGTFIDIAHDVLETEDGEYWVTGVSNSLTVDVSGHHGNEFTSDFWLAKLSQTGDLLAESSFGGSGDDSGWAILNPGSNQLILAGTTNSTDGDVNPAYSNGDYCVFKLNITTAIVSNDFSAINIFPNPAKSILTIAIAETILHFSPYLQIIDVNGKVVLSHILVNTNNAIPFNLTEGIYIIQIIGTHYDLTRKLLVE